MAESKRRTDVGIVAGLYGSNAVETWYIWQRRRDGAGDVALFMGSNTVGACTHGSNGCTAAKGIAFFYGPYTPMLRVFVDRTNCS